MSLLAHNRLTVDRRTFARYHSSVIIRPLSFASYHSPVMVSQNNNRRLIRGTEKLLDHTVKGAYKVATLGKGELHSYEIVEPEKGSGEPNRKKVGKVTQKQIEEIAKMKMPDLNTVDLAAAMRMVSGTAKSMGLELV